MHPSYRPDIPPPPHSYRPQVLDHLGLVAGMFEELGITEGIDKATQQAPAMRIVTVGHAVKAMVLNGLGFIKQQLSLVPHFFQNKPLPRLIAPGMQASHLNDDTLGRALETLYAVGGTELYRLMAATAAQRLGLAPRFAHLDSTSFHVAERYNSGEVPPEHVLHLSRGYRRDQRPDLNHVRLALIVEPQAGIPVLMQPLSGTSRDARAFGQLITAQGTPLQSTYGPPVRVAASALYSAENLRQLAETRTQWITRVPATWSEAQAVLAQADPQTMAPLTEGYRYRVGPSSYGGGEHRWGRIPSEPRQPQAQRTVDKHLLKHSEPEGKACQQLCRTAFACEAEAQQALATFAQGLQATSVAQSTVQPSPRDAKRGRPSPDTPPEHIVYQLDGTLARRSAARQALIDQHRCFILATNARDDTLLPPQGL